MGTIWVKAPQVSYVNEIVELVKVFYPEGQVTSISNEDETFGFGHTDIDYQVDMLLEMAVKLTLVFWCLQPLWEAACFVSTGILVAEPSLAIHAIKYVSTDNRKTNEIKNG